MRVKRPVFSILYNSEDITTDISPFVLELSYVDHVEGKADSLEMTVENSDYRWMQEWYPGKKDTLELVFGYVGSTVSAGIFTIDEMTASGPPHRITVRGISAGINKALRTKVSKTFEKQTLAKIAQDIATKHGLSLQGDIEDILIERITQSKETDLSFLCRISKQSGHVFSIRNSTMTFQRRYDLEAVAPISVLNFQDVISYSFLDKTTNTYKEATVEYHNPVEDELIQASRTATDLDVSEDTLKLYDSSIYNQKQGDEAARAELHKKNTEKITGSIRVEGNPYFLAGSNINLYGFGIFSGTYHILSSTHTLQPASGYVCELEIKRIAETTSENQEVTLGRLQKFNLV